MKRKQHGRYFTIAAFFMAIVAYQRFCQAEIDPALLKLKELATGSSAMNMNKTMAPSATGLLDNSINPESYYIGGGDVFGIHVVELPSVEYIVTVDQNCDAVISDLGIIRLGKITLSRAKAVISEFVRSKLKKSYEVYVALVRAKSALIVVSGGPTPGTYQVEGTSRILDVLALSNNHVLPSASEFNYREVIRENHDSSATYDLYRFLNLNDYSQNPYVYPGDHIHIFFAGRRITLAGCLKNPAGMFIPIKSNETVKEFLSLFTLEASADSNNIIVTQHDKDGVPRSMVFSLNHPENIILADKDMIFVSQKSNYPRSEWIQVLGEIVRPGYYPLTMQMTTAKMAIEQAGGPTQFGNLKRAFIIRKGKITAVEKALIPQSFTPSPTTAIVRTPMAGVRSEISSALSNVTVSKDYSVISLKNGPEHVLLEPSDEVVIPKIENLVYISGNVKSPGAYPFVEGYGPSYFIKQAGGLTSKGDKSNIFIVTNYSEQAYQVKENSLVDGGDIIIVPESQQYKFLTTVVFPIINICFSAISTAFVIYNVTK